MQRYKWGIIAPGNIADAFTKALTANPRTICHSVASRDAARAKSFASKHGFQRSHASYQALINDPEIDCVYIASPHTLHLEQSLAALNAGKATLCEKPMAVNLQQAQSIIESARNNKTFYMEAVWTRFLPVYHAIRQWLDEGYIGEVKMVQASFGFSFPFDPKHRLFDPKLAGGALLDMGIYPLTLSQWVFQQDPIQIASVGTLGQTGVDEQVAIALKYANGGVSHLGTTVNANTPHDAWIIGSKGKIHIQPYFWASESAHLLVDNADIQTVDIAHQINGYEYEINEVYRCLDEGLLESPKLTWETSLSVMKTMDQIRSQIGLQYPFE